MDKTTIVAAIRSSSTAHILLLKFFAFFAVPDVSQKFKRGLSKKKTTGNSFPQKCSINHKELKIRAKYVTESTIKISLCVNIEVHDWVLSRLKKAYYDCT